MISETDAKIKMLISLCQAAEKLARETIQKAPSTPRVEKLQYVLNNVDRSNRLLSFIADEIGKDTCTYNKYPYVEYENDRLSLVQPTKNGEYIAWSSFVPSYESGILFRYTNGNIADLFFARTEKKDGKIDLYTFADISTENYTHHNSITCEDIQNYLS